ncbi:hypothetical protein M231_02902 [Tremella mesenterica]|uniref:Zn(2)-C6 fungal-type domain-containing protein n=1 Tax=Tremella mesenterica TaxID=5217 RepID=A0A4Q1BPK6_TREME|nr:hypothetical protein M231_02902 [Tremella mesenterica]
MHPTDSPFSSSDHDRESKHSEPRPKRKRPVLSCLECKHRKTKCDKLLPCSTCVSRGDPSACTYDDGTAPRPSMYVERDELEALRSRVEHLERVLSSSSQTQMTPQTLASVSSNTFQAESSTATTPPVSKHNGETDAMFSKLEMMYLQQKGANKPTFSMPEQRGWPSVLNPHPIPTRDKWKRNMKEALDSLPPRDVTEALIDHYLADFQVVSHHIHEVVFRHELGQFWELVDTNQAHLVDPAWLALLLSVTSATAHSLMEDTSAWPIDMTEDALGELADDLSEGLETALVCADWTNRPQMRVLFAIVVTMGLT